jgi:predicted TIM-barrel fold metal-dependent hydrolase
MRQTLAMLQRYNIRAVTSGESGDLEEVSKWHAASDRIIPAASFERRGRDDHGRHLLREPAELRRLVAEGKIAVFAEVGPQYDGISPADPALDPYFALAEELEVPVGLHMGEGPPGGPNIEGYRVPSQDGKSVTPGRRAHSTSKTSHLRHALRLAFCG